jgi:hypothetical protein
VLTPKFPPPDGIQAGFNGDYSGITVDRNGIAHPIWSDTRNRVPNPDFNKATVDEDVFTAARPIPHRRPFDCPPSMTSRNGPVRRRPHSICRQVGIWPSRHLGPRLAYVPPDVLA